MAISRMNNSLVALSAALLLAGCASPEQRLRTGLINAGVAPPLSACMAADMAPQLNVTQLMRLRSLASVSKLDPMNTTMDRLLHRVRALGDPDILRVTGKAAARCALGL